jgi:hypothetical protein
MRRSHLKIVELQASFASAGSKTLAQIEGQKFGDTLVPDGRRWPSMDVETGLAVALARHNAVIGS